MCQVIGEKSLWIDRATNLSVLPFKPPNHVITIMHFGAGSAQKHRVHNGEQGLGHFRQHGPNPVRQYGRLRRFKPGVRVADRKDHLGVGISRGQLTKKIPPGCIGNRRIIFEDNFEVRDITKIRAAGS